MRNPAEGNAGGLEMSGDGRRVCVRVGPALAIGIRAVQQELLSPTVRGRLARQLELLLTGFAEQEAGLMKGAAAEILGELVLVDLEQPVETRGGRKPAS